ncbi:zinc finger and SCAN domain-containing protein 5B-like isoform X1 [Bubalus kerabau]|uniref:zinc finger and SCAN domain-containing protein 5B-like n=1 Tax=Bubalus carabanensis TaxID=3119969 RepID=UPI00244EDD8A|nr:zinc finger and SCAN domain-containing protein 5B-like [Bubalus carabanensis]XP_055409734.1 zinc finger and SCAN domain-containing protein 5B-like isoform X1 [Bubalus carabanensis]XP_055409735.1 zinc finger and SCAN domain-containing protein 5B-like isoform X1 [Bubalus carabanensis]
MAEDQPFFQGCGHMTDSPGAESPASVPPQDTLMEDSDCDQETWHVRFRTFSSSEESDPIEDLRRLRDLCYLWLRPDLHTKEQMMDRLVLEQFMICMPLECQVLLKESGVQSCKALEDVLRNKQKHKKWTIVCIQGQKYLVHDPDIEMVEAKAGDMDDERDPWEEPQTPVRVISPEDGQEASQELQNLPGPTNLSREQDQRALSPETVPETGELEGQTPRENLEKDLLEDRGETKTLQSQEPELLKGPEGDVSTMSGSRRGPLKNRRHVKRKWDRSPTCQDVRQEAAMCLDQGEFSGQLGSRSVGSSGTVGPISLPEGPETRGRAPSECRVCKKSFPYQSQLTLHQRTHTAERPIQCDICAKGFIQLSDLRVHERIHTGEKPYSCDLCLKKFTHDSTLRTHKRTHTQEKPFRCEHSDRAFSH